MFLIVVAACLIGWFAQVKRNRPAALWAGLVFCVAIPWLSYMGLGIQQGTDPGGLVASTVEETSLLMDIAIGVLPPTVAVLALLMVLKKPADAAST